VNNWFKVSSCTTNGTKYNYGILVRVFTRNRQAGHPKAIPFLASIISAVQAGVFVMILYVPVKLGEYSHVNGAAGSYAVKLPVKIHLAQNLALVNDQELTLFIGQNSYRMFRFINFEQNMKLVFGKKSELLIHDKSSSKIMLFNRFAT
jgi:hypothetical protein